MNPTVNLSRSFDARCKLKESTITSAVTGGRDDTLPASVRSSPFHGIVDCLRHDFTVLDDIIVRAIFNYEAAAPPRPFEKSDFVLHELCFVLEGAVWQLLSVQGPEC